MARRRADAQSVEAEVAALGDLDLAALRERWEKLFGNPPPKSLRRAFLVKACAYQTQVKAFGGLSAATKRRLRQIVEAARDGTVDAVVAAPRIKPGVRLVRAWRGTTHVVTVLADRKFEWNGERYGSLSAIARQITGTSWNGRAFFGVQQGNGRAAAGEALGRARDNVRRSRGRRSSPVAEPKLPDLPPDSNSRVGASPNV